jgi:hypothetical protein
MGVTGPRASHSQVAGERTVCIKMGVKSRVVQDVAGQKLGVTYAKPSRCLCLSPKDNEEVLKFAIYKD